MRIAWLQVIIAFFVGAFGGPWIMSMLGGKKAAASGGGY